MTHIEQQMNTTLDDIKKYLSEFTVENMRSKPEVFQMTPGHTPQRPSEMEPPQPQTKAQPDPWFVWKQEHAGDKLPAPAPATLSMAQPLPLQHRRPSVEPMENCLSPRSRRRCRLNKCLRLHGDQDTCFRRPLRMWANQETNQWSIARSRITTSRTNQTRRSENLMDRLRP